MWKLNLNTIRVHFILSNFIYFLPEFFLPIAFLTVSSAVHIYDFHIFIFIYFTIIGYMTNSQLIIYPCDLIGQWIEHCTGIERAWVRIPFKPEYFSGCFSTAKLISHCEDQISLMFHPQFTYMIFVYSYSIINQSLY